MKNYHQGDLFDAVEQSYLENNGKLSQQQLYANVASQLDIDPSEHIGTAGKQKNVNLFYRKVRWVQQSMKQKKLLTQLERGIWTLSGTAKERLHQINEAKSVIAMSTNLGIVICSTSQAVFDNDIIQEDIDLVLTSPPYLLQKQRHYGGDYTVREWVDFIVDVVSKILPRLADGASIALNIGQDSFVQGQPARHTHIERLTIALEDDLKLSLVDRIVWLSNKAPGPYAWCSLNRQMLHTGYEFVLLFTNNPLSLKSNNQRVLLPHSKEFQNFVRNGGTKKAAINSDGAHRKSIGDYSQSDLSKGKIATNNLYFSNKCTHNERVNKYAREVLSCPTHGAKFPYKLVEFLVKYLCPEGGLVLDNMSGTGTVGEVCQANNRRFICIEPIIEYIKQSFIRYTSLTDEVWINPAFR